MDGGVLLPAVLCVLEFEDDDSELLCHAIDAGAGGRSFVVVVVDVAVAWLAGLVEKVVLNIVAFEFVFVSAL